MNRKKEQLDKLTLGPGFYKTNVWPYYFQVINHSHFGLTLWGFSIYKKEPGYRTFGSSLDRWLIEYPNAKVYKDKDRTLVINMTCKFLTKYRKKNGI